MFKACQSFLFALRTRNQYSRKWFTTRSIFSKGWNNRMCTSVRIKEWEEGEISLDEVEDFLSIQNCVVPEDRPYTWSMTVSSLDGVIAFNEPNVKEDSKYVALHSSTDWKLLNAGWMQADAVLNTGFTLRSDLNCAPVPRRYPEMMAKRNPNAPQVIITGSGALPLQHKAIQNKEWAAIIVTTQYGAETFKQAFEDLKVAEPFEEYLRERNCEMKIFDHKPEDPTKLKCLKDIVQYLRKEKNIRFLDVTGGGSIISQLVQEKLIDEVRLTIAGQLCGIYNSVGDVRSNLFPATDPVFTRDNTPVLEFSKIRFQGKNHIFTRNLITYRH